ncbi:MAG: Coenzyme F420 hydrogenase/dehydrogenase, beta subunit C-terminal domain [Dongiaceae bacterium]
MAAASPSPSGTGPDLQTIVSHGLCAGCGLCESLAGKARVEMTITSYGQIRPVAKVPLDEPTIGAIRAVCPGIRVDGPDPENAGRNGRMDPIYGPIRSLHRGWSADPALRHHAAAGGGMTALSLYLLETKAVDAILHVRASTSAPMLTEAQVSRSRTEIVSGAQSRYGPAAPLIHVHRLLDEGCRFAVCAKPCDIAAIRNLGRIDSRVDAQIPYLITIFCGGVPTLHTAHKIAAHLNVAPDDVEVFRWRGEGWPGAAHIQTKNGAVHELDYDTVWYDSSKPWTYDIQYRCKICPDAIGELADVACPDGWVMEDGRPVHKEAPGQNVFVARTAKGEKLVSAAAAAGAIELAPISFEEFVAMHADHRTRKVEWPARVLALRLSAEPVPRFTRFRRWRMVLKNGFWGNLEALLGGLVRVREGRHREPLT